VAVVKEVVHDSGQPFAIVRAVPTAALNRSRYVLLVFTDTRTPEQRAIDSAEAQEKVDRQAEQKAAEALQGTTPATPPAAAASATPTPAPAAAKPATTPAKPATTPAAAPAKPAAQGERR
jgi:rod shape-determining protein MreC